jgi:hypothetical protein
MDLRKNRVHLTLDEVPTRSLVNTGIRLRAALKAYHEGLWIEESANVDE